MMRKSIDIKDRKILRSIELHPDLKPEAMKRMLNELSTDAMKRARNRVVYLIITD
jgi:hypothetical protein